MADNSPTLARTFEDARHVTVLLGALAKHPLNIRLPALNEDPALLALRMGISARGLIEPLLVVEQTSEDGDTVYLVVDGSRRLQALKALHENDHLVRVQVADLTEEQIIDGIASSDVSSTKLTQFERALLMKVERDLLESGNGVAERYGISKAAVSKHLALADLGPEVLACIVDRAQITIRGESGYRAAVNRDATAVKEALAPFRLKPATAREVFAAVEAATVALKSDAGPGKVAPVVTSYASVAAELLAVVGKGKRIAPTHDAAIRDLLWAITANANFALASVMSEATGQGTEQLL